MRLFDTHCHIHWDEERHPPAAQIARAREAGVEQLVCVAIDLPSGLRALELARETPGMRASIGLHPNDLGADAVVLEHTLGELDSLAATEPWSAIGETGLDCYRDRVAPELQRRSFAHHLELAARIGLPVIIHCREAAAEALEVLRAHGSPVTGVMHCYSEGPEPLADFLDLGLHISFAGNLTYPKAEPIREAARLVPEDRLVVETDAPFLAPQPVRGQRNEPAYVRHTLEHLAAVRGVAAEALAERTSANAEALFPPGPRDQSGPRGPRGAPG